MNQLRLSTLTAISSTISSPNLFLYLAVPPLLPYLVVSFLVPLWVPGLEGHFLFLALRFIVLVASNVCAVHNFFHTLTVGNNHLTLTRLAWAAMLWAASSDKSHHPLSPMPS